MASAPDTRVSPIRRVFAPLPRTPDLIYRPDPWDMGWQVRSRIDQMRRMLDQLGGSTSPEDEGASAQCNIALAKAAHGLRTLLCGAGRVEQDPFLIGDAAWHALSDIWEELDCTLSLIDVLNAEEKLANCDQQALALAAALHNASGNESNA